MIVVLGSNGMLGHIVADVFPGCQKISRKEFEYNGFNINGLLKYIYKGDVVINCIGYLNKYANINPIKAVEINSKLPIELSSLCSNLGAKLVHISTDCVYSGDSGNYNILSNPSPKDIYGASKMIGDNIDLSKHLLLRTSIVGPELKLDGVGLLDWLIKSRGKTINGWYDHIWSGNTTLQFAHKLRHIIHETGYHIVGGRKISKYDLANLINGIFKLDLKIIKTNSGYPCDRSMIASYDFPEITRELEIIQLYNYIIENKERYHHYD